MIRWRSLDTAKYFMCAAILLGCGETLEQERPPVYPGSASTIRASVLSPTGSLADVTADDALDTLTTGLGTEESPVLITDVLLEVLTDAQAEVEMTNKSRSVDDQNKQAIQIDRVQQPITADGSLNGWIELTVLCGEDPLSHSASDGVIDVTYLLNGVADGVDSALGIAWGAAKNCALWDQETPTKVDGEFSLIFGFEEPAMTVNGSTPIFYDFVGTQQTDVSQSLDVAGFYAGSEVGWSLEVGQASFIIGASDTTVFVHDCSGRWQCDLLSLSCTFLTSGSALVEPTCPRPSVESVSW